MTQQVPSPARADAGSQAAPPLIDLASRALAGSVMWASDELFAPRENLIDPAPPGFDPTAFSGKGKVYDGWESRRRRTAGNDAAVIRLGAPGVVARVVVDTAHFAGNYPPEVSVEGYAGEGFPDVEEVLAGPWHTLVPRAALAGDTATEFSVTDPHRYTHVRLSIYPDGGVARLRVFGRAVPDPSLLTGTVDLAAAENGAVVLDCSDAFYGSPARLLMPDRARTMGEGWENARRRTGGNDHVTIALAAGGMLRRIELDTSYFVGNAPGEAAVRAVDAGRDAGIAAAGGHAATVADLPDARSWPVLVPRRPLLADARHLIPVAAAAAVTHLRLDVFPDGGLARLRAHGELSAAGWEFVTLRWWNSLPAHALVAACAARWGIDADAAARLANTRPVAAVEDLPAAIRRAVSAWMSPKPAN